MTSVDHDKISEISHIKDKVNDSLMAIPGVHGVAVGFKYRDGRYTDELCIAVFLKKKRPLGELASDEIIPKEIEGIPTDVCEEPELPEYLSDDTRYRPLRGGSKLSWEQVFVSHPTPTSTTSITRKDDGTIGCFARARRTGEIVALTNAHVVAGCGPLEAAIGRRIGQPDTSADYTCCSKSWSTVFGSVVAAKRDPLNPDVDVAAIELDKCVEPSPEVQELGTISGVLTTLQLDAILGQTLKFRGARTAEPRQGVVRYVNRSGSIACNDGATSATHNYTNAIIVQSEPPGEALVQKGDSGSVVLTSDNKVVGLLFGSPMIMGIPSVAICRIDNILSVLQAELDLEIITAANWPSTSSPTVPFAVTDNVVPANTVFEPDEYEMGLLENARDSILGTPWGQHVASIIGRHVDEIRRLINTSKKVAVVWRRIATPGLGRSIIQALRSPEVPIDQLVEGQSLENRAEAFVAILSRYGSTKMIADLKYLYSYIDDIRTASYQELLAWLTNTPLKANQP